MPCPPQSERAIGTHLLPPQLVAFGTTLVPTYDPAQIEIIVTEPKLTQEQFCAKHGLQSVRDVPAHIPILKTSWVTSGEEKTRLDRWERHPSYKDHVVKQPEPAETNKTPVPRSTTATQDKRKTNGAANGDGKDKAKVRRQKAADSDESDFDGEGRSIGCARCAYSHVFEFPVVRIAPFRRQFTEGHAGNGKAAVSAEARPDLPPKQGRLSGSSISNDTAASSESSRADNSEDPLAQYYGVARAEQEEEVRINPELPWKCSYKSLSLPSLRDTLKLSPLLS